MVFRVKRNTLTYVSLLKYGEGVSYEANDKLTEYAVGRIEVSDYMTIDPYSGLSVSIQMKHLYASQILTIFIPTTIINIISYATFFFKWYDFQNRIMVSLTSLLVLMTLFSQVADTLPRTSYFKLVDIWFFFSIIYTFLIIMLHTLVEYFHLYEHEIRAMKECKTQKKEPDLPKSLDEKSELHRFWREAIKKTFESLQISVRIAPSTENKTETRETKQEDGKKKEKCPNWASKFVNKFGNVFSAVVYVVVNLVFWVVAFMQKIQENYKDYLASMSKPEVPDNVGYP